MVTKTHQATRTLKDGSKKSVQITTHHVVRGGKAGAGSRSATLKGLTANLQASRDKHGQKPQTASRKSEVRGGLTG